MIGIIGQFAFKFLARLIVLLRFPVEIPQPKMEVRLLWRNLVRSLEFSNRFRSLA